MKVHSEMEGSFYASKNWLQVKISTSKQINLKKSITYDFAANNNNENINKQGSKLKRNQIQMILQPPAGGELPKLYREEEACVQETSQLK